MNRLLTGVPGLDVVLGGGLEPGSVTVLAGAPGTGKTILAQQICFANASTGHHAVYYTTLSEPHSKLVRHLAPFSFFAPEKLGPEVEYIHLGDLIRNDQSSRMEPLVSEVVRKTMEEQPVVVVIDSAKALRDFAGYRELRLAFYDLTSRMAHTDAALLLLGEYTPEEMASGVEFSLADTIIQLAYEPREPVDRRWVRVIKMRGTRHLEGKHTFRITTSGAEVFPRIETLDAGQAADVTGRIDSGIPGLDPLMNGGISSGEATVILGPSGAGKTIFGLRFITEGLRRGEQCLYVTFQDTTDQLIKMAPGFGWDLATALTCGQLVVRHVPLGELDLDMLTSRIRADLADGPVHRVVIDSLAELVLAARETERFLAYARSLTGLIRAAGASLVITSETATLGPAPEPAGGGVTFLFHNLIQLRYIELNSATGRALNVVKMRNSNHAKNLEAFAYSVAHDLRSPLRALSGYSEALTEDYADRLDDTGRWYATRTQTATERMGQLIDDLLMLAQVSRTDINTEAADLSAEVTTISAELRAREPGRKVRFAIHDGVRVTADRSGPHQASKSCPVTTLSNCYNTNCDYAHIAGTARRRRIRRAL